MLRRVRCQLSGVVSNECLEQFLTLFFHAQIGMKMCVRSYMNDKSENVARSRWLLVYMLVRLECSGERGHKLTMIK